MPFRGVQDLAGANDSHVATSSDVGRVQGASPVWPVPGDDVARTAGQGGRIFLHEGHVFTDVLARRTSISGDVSPSPPTKEQSVSNIKASLEALMTVDGAIAAALVDWESGLTLGTIGGDNGFDIELAASGNTGVVRAKMTVMKALNTGGPIEDILITLKNQYHLLRPLTSNASLFIYVAIDKNRGNLDLARHKVRQIETALSL